MSTEENKALVRREMEEIFQKGNLDVAEEIYAPDYVAYEPTGEIRGVEGAKQFALTYREAFPDMQVTQEDQIVDGDKVVTRFTFRGTHQGELEGIAPTGNQVEVTGITIQRISEGKIAEEWLNYDALGLMQQLGAMEQPSG
jgi:steroid delta-isomerase-like uncharacterized protein